MAIIQGNNLNNFLNGTPVNDTINGLGGNDVLNGLAGNDVLNGGLGNDSLVGGIGNDVMSGGTGNDTLNGGAGNDVYNFGFAIQSNGVWKLASFGNDFVLSDNYNAGDRIIVDNIDGNYSMGNDLVLKVWDEASANNAGTITLQNWLVAGSNQRIHKVTVRDGYYSYFGGGNTPKDFYFDVDNTASNTKNFTGNNTNQMYYGWSGNDTITGGNGADLLFGDRGNDTVSGGVGDDNVYGGNDNDRLSGGAGNDFLRGGAGNDTLIGGAGSDVYRFGSGSLYNTELDGNDVIQGDANDILYLRNTDTPYSAKQVGSDLILYYWNANTNRDSTIKLQNWYGAGFIGQYRQKYSLDASGYGENNIYKLAAGSNGINNVNFTGNTNRIMWFGLEGNDTYHGGERKDRIWGGGGADSIFGGNDNDWMRGEAGNDKLYGEAGNDLLQGGGGNDLLTGGTGNDIYRFGNGDETSLQEDFGKDTIAGSTDNAGDVIQLRNINGWTGGHKYGNDLVLDFVNGERGGVANTITIQNWFKGAGYQLHSVDYLAGTYPDMGNAYGWLTTGTDMADTVTFSSYSNNKMAAYLGLGGNDTIRGGTRMDILFGGEGNDSVYGGAGDDELQGGAGADRLYGDAGNDALLGGTGNDLIYGGAGSDRIWGDSGNDTLYGGAGSDVYFFYGTCGHDQIGVEALNPNTQDTILFDGLSHGQVTGASSGLNAVFSYGSGDNVTVLGWNSSANNQITFQFTDGSFSWNGSGWQAL